MRDFEATIDQLQAIYVDHISNVFNKDSDESTVTEAQAFDQDDRPVKSTGLELPQRVDMVSNGALLHVSSAKMLNYGMLMGNYGPNGMRLMMEEFTWDNCSLQLPYEIDGQDDLLRDWFMSYFGDAPAGTDGIMGVVHFMSDPEPDQEFGILYIDIDFGTAPASAFWDLVQRLHDHGFDVIRFALMPDIDP